jgi:Protein of unknwon function (DUF3310)
MIGFCVRHDTLDCSICAEAFAPGKTEFVSEEELKKRVMTDANPCTDDYRIHKGTETRKNDPVNHPLHYTSHPSGVECITITRHLNFNIGNAIKYLWRAGLKENDINSKGQIIPGKRFEDLKKAIWYINDEITRLTKEK